MNEFKASLQEKKFVLSNLSSTSAHDIRQIVRAHLHPDIYMQNADDKGYWVHTVYLDTPEWKLYHQAVDGKKKRYKLRMRFYDDSTDGSVFLEVKQRTARKVVRRRAAVSKPAAKRLLAGEHLTANDLLFRDESSETSSLSKFCQLRDKLDAHGSIIVSFQREAFESHVGEHMRATFDRLITVRPYSPVLGFDLDDEGQEVAPGTEVMELKYTGTMPDWMQDLINDFGLKRASFPKYVQSVDVLRERSSVEMGEPATPVLLGDYVRELV